jgi:hypothetical protein
VHGGEFVFTKEQTRKAGVGNARGLGEDAGRLRRSGGFVSTARCRARPSTAPYRIPISTPATRRWTGSTARRSDGSRRRLRRGPLRLPRRVRHLRRRTCCFGSNQAIVQQLAASMYGWTGTQWDALYRWS